MLLSKNCSEEGNTSNFLDKIFNYENEDFIAAMDGQNYHSIDYLDKAFTKALKAKTEKTDLE